MKKIDKEELHSIFVGIKNNNELEFNKLYEKYEPLVYGIAFSILKNKEDSEEVAQATFIKIFKLEKEKLPTNHEASWIYKVAKNEAISYLRQRKENIDIEKIYEIEDNNQIDKEIDKIWFNELISRLNDIEQEIVSLKILSNLSFNEIAKLLGKPTGTIKWKYYKAVDKLNILLGNTAIFIFTFIMGLHRIIMRNIKSSDEKSSEEQMKDKVNESSETKEETKDEEKKKEESTNETLREDENEAKNETKEENIIPDNTSKTDYLGIGILSISGVFLMLTIIFSIFLVKYKLKHKTKTSK